MRSSGLPTYNFACVLDDIDMRISHVIRGDDHVENTFRQLLLYEALGARPPQFAHLPMIHNDQGKKLSKRDGAVAVTDYQQEGYLPEAVVNYLALLGWSPGDNTEIMSSDELIRRFDLDRVKRSPARFDFEKFRWMNSQYIHGKPDDVLAALLRPFLEKAGRSVADDGWLAELVSLLKERIEVLADFVPGTDYFFTDEFEYDEKGMKKFVGKEPGRRVLEAALERLGDVEFTDEELEKVLRGMTEEFGVGFSKVAQPLRLAVSGRTATPGIFETLRLLGKEKTLSRLKRMLERTGE
jgi:glutamyl-tRNA synthetase